MSGIMPVGEDSPEAVIDAAGRLLVQETEQTLKIVAEHLPLWPYGQALAITYNAAASEPCKWCREPVARFRGTWAHVISLDVHHAGVPGGIPPHDAAPAGE